MRSAASPAPRVQGAEILMISLIGFLGIFSTTMSKSPVLPLFVKALSGSDTVVGLIAAVSPLAGILFSFPVGMLADTWGKKRLLVVAGFVFLLAPLLYFVVASSFSSLCNFRVWPSRVWLPVDAHTRAVCAARRRKLRPEQSLN